MNNLQKLGDLIEKKGEMAVGTRLFYSADEALEMVQAFASEYNILDFEVNLNHEINEEDKQECIEEVARIIIRES